MSSFPNRRRILEQQEAYRNTTVPCGNPQRYGSAEVTRMDPVTCLGKRKLVGGDPEMETEAQKHLQAMAKKQLNTNVSLGEQFSQHRDFTSAGEYKPATKTLSGVSKLEDYQEVVTQDSNVEELTNCGLTEEEIQIKLGSETYSNRQGYGVNPQAHKDRLAEIDQHISDRKQISSLAMEGRSGVRELGRHDIELEHRLTGPKSHSRTLSDFLIKQKVVKGDPNDPLNNLPEILSDIEKKGCAKKVSKRAGGDGLVTITDECEEFIGPLLPPEVDSANEVQQHKQPPPEVDGDGRRIVVDTVDDVPEDVIKRYRLKLDEIRALPRFENYSPGEPTNVLFLKNMSSKVTEQDLVSLFGRFQRSSGERIVYRLMTGRMKGQAFVTFPDIQTSGAALELLNGYDFRGKPIIIQYGKKSSSNIT